MVSNYNISCGKYRGGESTIRQIIPVSANVHFALTIFLHMPINKKYIPGVSLGTNESCTVGKYVRVNH